jgi:tetratricopeptide (TPR) repeat protein
MTRRHRLFVLLGALALALALPAAAHAEDAESGRRYFKRGQDLLKANDFRAAAHAFEAGYAAAPRVGFLLNIGNCYRKLGELGKAREYYWRFLDAAPKDHPSRPAVLDYLRAMEQIEADGVSVDASPATRTVAPPPSADSLGPPPAEAGPRAATVPRTLSARPAAPAPPAAGGLSVVDLGAMTEESKPPLWKRWWFWAAVGGAVAAGAATYVLTRPGAATGCSATLGCTHE